MDGSVRQILDPRVLAKSYEQTSVSIATPFSDAFWGGEVESISDDTYKSMYDPTDVKPAQGNVAGAPARPIQVGASRERTFNSYYSFNEMNAPGDVLLALREPDSYAIQEKGVTELRRLLRKFRKRHVMFKEVVLRNLIVKGVVYFDAVGNILDSSSGAVITVTTDVPAGNQGNIGGIISALWSVAGTDIFTQLDNIRRTAARSFVPVPNHCWVNAANFYALRNNTGSGLQTYFSRNAELNNVVMRKNDAGEEVEYTVTDVNGFTWHFLNAVYQDKDGTAVDAIPVTGAGSVVLTPSPNGDWFAKANGRTLVPNSLEPAATMEESLRNMPYQEGGFFYSKLEHNPVSLKVFEGVKFFAGFNEPGAVWQCTAF
jgi:hypothetical protein